MSHNPLQPGSISRNAFLGTAWAGVAVSLGFLIFRIYVRLKVFRRIFIDDPFVIAAWLMTVANAAIWQAAVGPLYLTVGVNSSQITVPPSEFEENFFVTSHTGFASFILYYTCLYTVKASFLLFFRALGNKIKRQRLIWWAALLFMIASYVISCSLVDFKCFVGPKATALVYCASPHAAHYERITIRIGAALDVVTDALIILVSTNILWNVQINIRKKLALACICSLTAFVICISITRVIIGATGDRYQGVIKLMFWSNLELCVAIIVACLASFRTLYTRSDRPKNRSPKGTTLPFRGGSYGVSPKSRSGNATWITANDNAHKLQLSLSTTTSEERMLTSNEVYVHHDLSVLPEPEKAHSNETMT